jgi:hypothetical protein
MRSDGTILARPRSERQTIGQFTGVASEQQHLDEHFYNCRLIEAAPDMYEALKLVRASLRMGAMSMGDFQRCVDALAKAEGRREDDRVQV